MVTWDRAEVGQHQGSPGAAVQGEHCRKGKGAMIDARLRSCV